MPPDDRDETFEEDSVIRDSTLKLLAEMPPGDRLEVGE